MTTAMNISLTGKGPTRKLSGKKQERGGCGSVGNAKSSLMALTSYTSTRPETHVWQENSTSAPHALRCTLHRKTETNMSMHVIPQEPEHGYAASAQG